MPGFGRRFVDEVVECRKHSGLFRRGIWVLFETQDGFVQCGLQVCVPVERLLFDFIGKVTALGEHAEAIELDRLKMGVEGAYNMIYDIFRLVFSVYVFDFWQIY